MGEAGTGLYAGRNPNKLAYFALYCLTLLWYSRRAIKNGFWYLPWSAATMLVFTIIPLTASRSGLLNLLIFLAIVMLEGKANYRKFVGLAVVDLGYATNAFGFAYDRVSNRMLVDRSASFHHAFEPLRAAALTLVDHGLSSADRVFVASFTDRTRLLATGRGEAARVLAAIPALPEPGLHPTALFDAIWQALGTVENADARAALIVVSDGCDTTGGWSRVPSVALRAREKAIPVFLLLPDRDECKFAKSRVRRSRSVPLRGGELADDHEHPPRGRDQSRRSHAGVVEDGELVTGATVARDQFSSLIADAGGGTFVAPAPEEWQRALRAIFDQLARQWTVVFDAPSEDVGSDEVKVYLTSGARRQRLR